MTIYLFVGKIKAIFFRKPDLLRQPPGVNAADADDTVVAEPRVQRLCAVPVRRRLALLVHNQARRPYLLRLEVTEEEVV